MFSEAVQKKIDAYKAYEASKQREQQHETDVDHEREFTEK